MKHLFIILTFTAAAATASTNEYAQATATETNVFLGQVFNLDVIVKHDGKPETPQFSGQDNFNVRLLDAGIATSEENTWLYRFALRAKHEGALQVPVLRFGNLYTKPINIRAHKPEESDRMKLNLKLSKTSIYLGEPVLLSATWDSTYQFGAIKAVDFYFPVLSDNRFQVLELFEPDKENNSQATGLPVHGTRVLATRNSYKTDEIQHQALTFSKLLIPKKSGTITLQPATLLCAAAQEKDTRNPKTRRSAFQYPSYFDNTFFDQNVTGSSWTRIYAESAPVELEVKPLPTADRPDLFNGMVGDYEIKVEAEPKDVRVGEPITLTITVTASNHMENIFFEPLRYQPLLVNRFEIPSDRSLPQRVGKSKIYTQTIRPLSTSNNEVPPLQLAYFSPVKEAYVTVQSAPIPLKVSPADEVAMFGGNIYQSRLRAVEEGIRQNYENPDMLQRRSKPLFGIHLYAVLGILILPPVLVGGISLVSLFGEKRHHIHRTAKAARAYKVYRKNAAHIVRSHSMKSEIYKDLDQVLRAYLGDRLQLSPGALSFRDAESKLVETSADAKDIENLKALFAVCEAYRFTRGYNENANARSIVQNAVRTVKALERSLK